MNYTIKSMHYKEKCEKTNKFTILLLTDETRLNYIECTLANCGVRSSKAVLLSKANSAPIRAFFVRCVYAPIQYSLFSDSLFSW